ncbi:SDR family oxidoreductase [Candidatus Gracilibacteria bacterium]|nr:SDR family oxidoreductase [Candidatus Gracilibacteria bacterium]
MNQLSLSGKVALITGAGSGLGEATALAFARAGAAVACVDIHSAAAARTAATIVALGGSAEAYTCNVADAAAVFASIDAAVTRFGRLDVVVNCAAVDFVVAVDEMSVEQWDRVLAVNLRGPFLVAKAALPTMKRQQAGHIVNIASTAAVRAWGNAAAYHASKWGLIGFGRGLGVEGRSDNIRITTVIPGGMRTHWFDKFPEQGIPLPDEQHLQDPANVADAIVFAVTMPPQSVIQELMVTPLTETSWP